MDSFVPALEELSQALTAGEDPEQALGEIAEDHSLAAHALRNRAVRAFGPLETYKERQAALKQEESMQNRGVIRLLLAVPGHHSRAGSRGSAGGRCPRACRSARPCARPGRAARSPGSNASAASWSCACLRSR